MSLGRSGQTCLVHKQTGTAQYSQQSTLTDPLHHACSTNKEKTTKEASRTASVSEQGETTLTDIIHEETWLHFSICACHLHQSSRNSIGHGGRYNMVVTASTSQHPASKRLSWDESFCPQSCEHHAPILRCLHHRRSAIFPTLWVSGSNNSAQCSSNPETLQFPHWGMSNPSFLPICPELLVAHVLSSCLPRFPAYPACSSRWDQACSTVEPTLSAPPSVLLYALAQDVVWWPWRCCCHSKLRCWTFVLSGAPASEARASCQYSSRRWAPCLWVSSPVCIQRHMDDVVQLPHQWEIQYTSVTSFEVTRDSLQFCLWGCGRSSCLSHDFLRAEGNVEALLCHVLTYSSTESELSMFLCIQFLRRIVALLSRSGDSRTIAPLPCWGWLAT